MPSTAERPAGFFWSETPFAWKGLLVVPIVLASAGACRTTSEPGRCLNPLSIALSPAEEEIATKLSKPDTASPPQEFGRTILYEGIITDASRLPFKEWDAYLAEHRRSSSALEAQALLRLQQRYWQAIANYERVSTSCKAPTGQYSGAWLETLQREFGAGALKQNATALRRAIMLIHLRVTDRCKAAAWGELLIAETDYHVAFEGTLRDWIEFLKSNTALTPVETGALVRRAEALAAVLHKTSFGRTMAVARETALLEIEAEKLPPPMASALGREGSLSKPFPVMRALDDLRSRFGTASEQP